MSVPVQSAFSSHSTLTPAQLSFAPTQPASLNVRQQTCVADAHSAAPHVIFAGLEVAPLEPPSDAASPPPSFVPPLDDPPEDVDDPPDDVVDPEDDPLDVELVLPASPSATVASSSPPQAANDDARP